MLVVVTLAPVVLTGTVWICLRMLGLTTGAAGGLAAVVGALFTTFVVLHVATVTSGWFPEPSRLWLLTALRAAMIGVAAAVVVAVLFSWTVAAASAAGCAVALVAALLLRRSVETETTTRSPVPSRLQSPAQVDAALRSAQIRLNDPRVQGSARIRAEIDRASALSMAAFLPDAPSHLDEATATLDTHARSSALPLGLRFYAASELVQARSLQAERTRNAFGYTGSLGLQAELAQAPGAESWWHGLALLDQGDHRLYLAREAADEGRDAGTDATAALELFRRALPAFGPGAHYEPLLRLKIAQQTFLLTFVDPDRHHLSLPHEIRDLRETRRYFRGRRRDGYEFVELALAQLLLLAVDEAERVTPQLDEAEAICRSLSRRGVEPEVAGYRHDLQAEAARLRLELTPGLTDEQRSGLQHARISALHAAFLAHRQLSVADAAQAGREWARATAEAGDVHATADAYAELARQVPVEVLRRLDTGKRATFVATQQGVATEAGYWLGVDRRPAAAIDAVENARAILLGQRAPGLPVDAERRLRERGRPDLYAAYRAVAAELDAVERTLYADGQDAAALAAIHGVRGRHDRVVREIGDLLDDVAEPGSTVARAAAAGGVLVYLGAAEREGYALTVQPDGAASWLPLPRATRTEVDALLGAVPAVPRRPGAARARPHGGARRAVDRAPGTGRPEAGPAGRRSPSCPWVASGCSPCTPPAPTARRSTTASSSATHRAPGWRCRPAAGPRRTRSPSSPPRPGPPPGCRPWPSPTPRPRRSAGRTRRPSARGSSTPARATSSPGCAAARSGTSPATARRCPTGRWRAASSSPTGR